MSPTPNATNAPNAPATPLVIADQGGFWIGTGQIPTAHGTLAQAAMYVQYQIPAEQRHPWPIVMVHGGGGQGTDFLHTPDGRPGWATWFLRQGYAVYVVDRPGHGRSPFHPDALGPLGPAAVYEQIMGLFTAPDPEHAPWPQARLHSQWPGTGRLGDPALDQLLASLGPLIPDLAATQALMLSTGTALLERIGPAILLTHSMGGPLGWLVADARPDLVKAIVAVEPLCPPFGELAPGLGKLVWGVTALPMTFEPPAERPEDLQLTMQPPQGPGEIPSTVQVAPARQLVRLRHIPTALVTGEASFMAPLQQAVADFLAQAGVPVEHLKLQAHGLHGNGHMMMAEKNSDAVAALIDRWLQAQRPTA